MSIITDTTPPLDPPPLHHFNQEVSRAITVATFWHLKHQVSQERCVVEVNFSFIAFLCHFNQILWTFWSFVSPFY